MKQFFSIGLAMLAGALALVSCNKQENAQPTAQTTSAVAHKDYGPVVGKEFHNWRIPCGPKVGNCLEEVIIRPQVHDELKNIIPMITGGNKSGIQTEFATQRDLLAEVFPATLIDGVVSGSYTLTYQASPSINRNWFVFSASSTVVNYVATPMN